MITFLSVSHGCSQTQITDPPIPKTEDYSTAETDTQNSTGPYCGAQQCTARQDQDEHGTQSDSSPGIQRLIE